MTSAHEHPNRPTWLEIDRDAIFANVRKLRRHIDDRCLLTAVVKANAYGHGAGAVAQTCLAGGAQRLAVATLGEGQELRAVGIKAPIHVLGYTPPRDAGALVAAGLIATVYELSHAQALAQAAQSANHTARVHLKVNTGMNRLGVLPAAAPQLLGELHAIPNLEVEGIYTHFATADTDPDFAQEQFAHFARLLDHLAQAGIRPPIAHAANSAATLAMPDTHLDMVRCGIAVYGLHPDIEGARLPPGFRPALSWKAEIAHVFRLQPGDAVSYGREYIADGMRTAAVIPVGYADGFPRRPHHWQSVLINGVAAPILGRVCMDQTVVDVTDALRTGPVHAGDEAVLIGRQGNAELSADTIAARLGTINYDVVSRILSRVPRLHVNRQDTPAAP